MFFLSTYIRPYWKLLILVLILATINQVASMMDPQVFRLILDNYIIKANTFTQNEFIKGISILLLASMGVAMISRISKNIQDYLANRMTQTILTQLNIESLTHLFKLPYAVFEDHQSGLVVSKITNASNAIKTFLDQAINQVFLSVIGLLVTIVYAFTVHWTVAVGMILLIPIMGTIMYYLSKKIKSAQSSIAQETATLSGSITETLRNTGLIKSLGLESQELHRISEANHKILGLELNKLIKVRSNEFRQGTIINFMRIILMALMFWLIYRGEITLGEYYTLFIYSFYIFGPLYNFGSVVKAYQEAKASHEVLQELYTKQIEPETGTVSLSELNHISFNDVSFGYDEKQVLNHITFDLTPGKTIAFVGPSGSGKSTIIKLLCGLYTPQHGSITINNQTKSDIIISQYKSHIGLVSQDTQLFSGTIRDNLVFVRPGANDEECMQAIEAAQLSSFVAQASQGLDTKIGEGGLKLSGGQKQRLAIARALLRNPSLLIFDEATSALDSIVEAEISETIAQLSQSSSDLMTVLVAHRLSTIKHADTIYVMKRGSIIESGNHDDLVAQGGLYAAMWRLQSGE